MHNRWKRLKAIGKSLNNGCSLKEACEGAKIRRVTLWRWRKDNPKIDNFIKSLLDNRVQEVEDALFKRAKGYRYEEITKEREESASEKKIVKVVIKEVAPDTTACLAILFNEKSEKWKDRRALVQNTNIIKNTVNNNPVSKLNDEELDGIISGFIQKR